MSGKKRKAESHKTSEVSRCFRTNPTDSPRNLSTRRKPCLNIAPPIQLPRVVVRVFPVEQKWLALRQAVLPDRACAVEHMRVFGGDVFQSAVAFLDQVVKSAGFLIAHVYVGWRIGVLTAVLAAGKTVVVRRGAVV